MRLLYELSILWGLAALVTVMYGKYGFTQASLFAALPAITITISLIIISKAVIRPDNNNSDLRRKK